MLYSVVKQAYFFGYPYLWFCCLNLHLGDYPKGDYPKRDYPKDESDLNLFHLTNRHILLTSREILLLTGIFSVVLISGYAY